LIGGQNSTIQSGLLTLFSVQSHASKTRAVLLELQLLRARTTQQNVVDVARFLTNEERSFFLFLALGHG